MKREVRLVDFFTAALERVAIGLFRPPKIGRVEIAVPIEHLDKSHGDDSAGWAAHFESSPPREVLAEIEHRLTRRRAADTDWLKLNHPPDRRGFRSQESGSGRIAGCNGRPSTIVVSGLRPTGTLQSRVVRLSTVDVRC